MRILAALALLLLAAGPASAQRGDTAGKFDYYALALSWSPSYCAFPGAARNEPHQCGTDRSFAFVVHGLWPQYERGFPRDCASTQPRSVTPILGSKMLDIMPSPRLIQHEWETHGLCSGLSQTGYFDTLRKMRNKVVVPPVYTNLSQPLTTSMSALRTAFVKENRGLRADGLAVSCDKNQLREVRICFSKSGAFRSCSSSVRDQCAAEVVSMPPMRRAQSGPAVRLRTYP